MGFDGNFIYDVIIIYIIGVYDSGVKWWMGGYNIGRVDVD